MGRPPGQGPARDYRVREPETSPRARARGSLLKNGHGDLPPAGGTRRSDVFPTFFRQFHGEPVPRGRCARVSAQIAEGAYETGAMINRAFLCCTLQGAAGGSGMPTLVCSCRDMRRGRSLSVCARGMCPLQAASSPEWVGHDAMMISLEYREFVTSLSGLRFWRSRHEHTSEDTRNRMISVWDSTHSKRKFYHSTRLTAIRRINELYRRHV